LTTCLHEPERFRSPAYLNIIDPEPARQTVRIDASAIQQMRTAAETGYPLEVCGLLVGCLDAQGWLVSEIREVANLNEERAADRFQLDPEAYQKIDRQLRGTGLEIIGVYHSHPDCPAKPSPTDLASAWEGFAYPIVSVYDGTAVDIACWCSDEAGERFSRINITEVEDA